MQGLLRWTLIAGAVGLGLSASAAGLYGWHWWSHDRHAALLVAKVKIDPSRCSDAGLPVWFELFNGSSKTIEHASFYVTAKRPGQSEELAELHKKADYLIPPNKRLFACAAPAIKREAQGEDIRVLEWNIGLTNVRFSD